jgi:hypothetical protein
VNRSKLSAIREREKRVMAERSEDEELVILYELQARAQSRVAGGDERARILLAAIEQLIVEREQYDGDDSAGPPRRGGERRRA